MVITGGLSFIGYVFVEQSPGAGIRSAIALPATGLGLLLAIGAWHAVRDSWLSRNAHWVLPVAATPIAFVLPYAGKLLHAVYLTDVFGIPADAVSVPFYWQFLVALKPLALMLAVLLLFVGAAGWVKYFHWTSGLREVTLFVWPLVLLVWVLTVIQVGIEDAGNTANRAAATARAGKNPTQWFGIQGNLMCVTPLTKKTSVFNGPIPHHPVLTFGTTGDHVWAWDPVRNRSADRTWKTFRIRAEEVSVTPPASGQKGPVCQQKDT